MAEWWEKPYKGGPMVAVDGFPRPLYAPYESGELRSVDGPDVLAYKRTVSRMGRWEPWDPDGWDDSFNEKFSQGRGTGNVGDSGVRGIQRQQYPDDPDMHTGNVGEKTFNLMRSARVPKGPHEGEMAMDGQAVDLINQAWAKFKGKEPPPPDTDDKVRQKITEFCNRGMGEPDWNYSQNRAIDVTVNPDGPVTSDCSGSAIQMFKFAGAPDPSKYNFAGWGNTWDDLDGHPKVTNGQYKVGDLAHYDGHVCVCMKAGNADSADWWSFGSEPPSKRKLYYRTDFKFVVRPPMSPIVGTYSTTFERLAFWLQFWKVQRAVLFWRNGKRRGDPATDPP